MNIFHLEANGRENTADYVRTISDATGLPGIKVFTSEASEHGQRALPVFGKYGTLNPGLAKLGWYLLGWSRLLCHLKKSAAQTTLHIHWPRFSPTDLFFLWILALLCPDLRLIHTVHNRLPHRPKFYDRFCFSSLYGLTDHLIFHSEQNISDFVHEFGPVPKPYSIIPHYGYQVQVRPLPPEGKNSILFFIFSKPIDGLIFEVRRCGMCFFYLYRKLYFDAISHLTFWRCEF